MYILVHIPRCFLCHPLNPLPAAVASGDGDKSDVSPLHSLPTRSRVQALNKRVKGERVCVCLKLYSPVHTLVEGEPSGVVRVTRGGQLKPNKCKGVFLWCS